MTPPTATDIAICAEPGCANPAHARGLCPSHYNKLRRSAPDAVDVRTRAKPGATLDERIAAHSTRDHGHLIWNGLTNRGVPGLVTYSAIDDDVFPVPDGRKYHNVRHIQLAKSGRPRPSTGNWTATVTCGRIDCVNPDHLTWTNRRADVTLPNDVVDDLIQRHARGDLNVADEADRLGVGRQTVYRAMHRRGYRPVPLDRG